MRLAIARVRLPRLARSEPAVDGVACQGGPCVKCQVLSVREREAQGYYSVLPPWMCRIASLSWSFNSQFD